MSDSAPTLGRILSATFLVTGTTIGGGMLALPVATGLNGFFPSSIVMALCCFFMTATALLLLEATLWFGEGAHMMTMTSALLGRTGKFISTCVYLFICYASIIAYTAGGGAQVAEAAAYYFGLEMTQNAAAVLFLCAFYFVIYLGSRTVGRVNTILFVAMILAYLLLVGVGIGEIKTHLLRYASWDNSLLAIPLLLTSFSFQTMVPSLVPYLKRRINPLRWAVVGGTVFTFVIYLIWQALVLGIIPIFGKNGLAQALTEGIPATIYLRDHVASSLVTSTAEFFAFFAIGTSFLGITFGLIDFLADGLSIKKEGKGNLILAVLIIIPTLIIATQFERIFLLAMDTSGGFGDAILNGMIPVLMVWVGRYKLGYSKEYAFPGGKVVLAIIFAFFALAFGIEAAGHLGYCGQVCNAEELIHKVTVDPDY